MNKLCGLQIVAFFFFFKDDSHLSAILSDSLASHQPSASHIVREWKWRSNVLVLTLVYMLYVILKSG